MATPNRHGTHIWYELLTTDADAAGRFYAAVMGWTVHRAGPSEIDYRRMTYQDEGVGGIATLNPGMQAAGVRPCWLGYIGVTDVDAVVRKITEAGGGVHVPPTDIPGIGRFAMVNDPQGAVFYVMRGASDEPSTAFGAAREGHGSWHELHTTDQAAAIAFYSSMFDWRKSDAFDMGPLGTYQMFAGADGGPIGGMQNDASLGRPAWLYYFAVGNIDAAGERVRANGGAILDGPEEVPGGDFTIQATDPQGTRFSLVGRRR